MRTREIGQYVSRKMFSEAPSAPARAGVCLAAAFGMGYIGFGNLPGAVATMTTVGMVYIAAESANYLQNKGTA